MIKIMIIEDDKDNLELLAECLEMENYKVIAFARAQEALAYLTPETTPDLLLMDLCFHDLTAEHFASEFGHKTGHPVPIIVLSGKPDIKSMSEKVKAVCYFQKPYDLFKLYAEIESVMDLQKEPKAA